jgi:hypothetical protein
MTRRSSTLLSVLAVGALVFVPVLSPADVVGRGRPLVTCPPKNPHCRAATTPAPGPVAALASASVTVALLVQGDATHNAKWTVTVVAGGGTYLLSTFWTPGIQFAWNATVAEFETTLENALDYDEYGDMTHVTKVDNVYTIEFIGFYGLTDIQHITVQSIDNLLPPVTDPVLVGAGDITNCNDSGGATAALIGSLPDAVVQTFGDNEQAGSPTLALYQNCFAPTWGQYLSRLHPAEGNHDGASGGAYFTYFGASAGAQGYYSYDVGTAWHIVVLNTECPGGCGAGSAQELWLKADLAAHAGARIGAIWHKPVFSSGSLHGNDATAAVFWTDLMAARACFVLNGHDHDYERFAPQDVNGNANAAGPVEFVVGTGGYGQRGFGTIRANSVVRQTGTFGVLRLTLHANGFDFAFVPVAGQTFTDTGSTTCN